MFTIGCCEKYDSYYMTILYGAVMLVLESVTNTSNLSPTFVTNINLQKLLSGEHSCYIMFLELIFQCLTWNRVLNGCYFHWSSLCFSYPLKLFLWSWPRVPRSGGPGTAYCATIRTTTDSVDSAWDLEIVRNITSIRISFLGNRFEGWTCSNILATLSPSLLLLLVHIFYMYRSETLDRPSTLGIGTWSDSVSLIS